MRTDPETLRCINCRYDLRGLTEHRCPECGRAFDPNDPFSTYTHIVRQRLRLIAWLPGVLLGTAFITLYALPQILSGPFDLPFRNVERFSRAFWSLAALAIAWSVRTVARRSILWPIATSPPRLVKTRRFLMLAAVVGIPIYLSGGISRWSCPHGDNFAVGPFVVTWNSENGPCGNYGWLVWKAKIGHERYFVIYNRSE